MWLHLEIKREIKEREREIERKRERGERRGTIEGEREFKLLTPLGYGECRNLQQDFNHQHCRLQQKFVKKEFLSGKNSCEKAFNLDQSCSLLMSLFNVQLVPKLEKQTYYLSTYNKFTLLRYAVMHRSKFNTFYIFNIRVHKEFLKSLGCFVKIVKKLAYFILFYAYLS